MADKDNGNDGDKDPFEGFTEHETDGKEPAAEEGSLDTPAKAVEDDAEGSEGAEDDVDDAEGAEDDDDAEEDAEGDEDDVEDDDVEDDEEEAAEEDEDDEEDLDEEEEEAPRKKKPVSKRISELTKKRYDETRRADVAEERAAGLEQRLADLEKRLPGNEEDDKGIKSDEAAEADELKKPDPNNFTYGEVDPEYIDALTEYRVDVKLAARDKKRQETEQAETAQKEAVVLATKFNTKVDEGTASYKDFKKVVVEGADKNKYPLSRETAMMALDSPVGHHVLYKIAKSPKLAAKIAQMSPLNQAKEFGRIEAQFTSTDAPKKKKATAATLPAPRRKSNVGAKKLNAGSSFADFEKHVMQRRRQSKR